MTESDQIWICSSDDTMYSTMTQLHVALRVLVRDIAPAFVDCTVTRFCYLSQLLNFPFKFVVVTAARRTGHVCVRPEDVEALDLWLEWVVPEVDADGFAPKLTQLDVPWIYCKRTDEMIMVQWVRTTP